MRRISLGLEGWIALSLIASGVAAKPPAFKKLPVLVLPVKAKGIEAEQAQTVGVAAGAALVQELSELELFTPLAGKAISPKIKTLKNRKVLLPDCQDNPRCMSQVNRAFGTRAIFFVHVGKGSQQPITIGVRVFDGQNGREVKAGESEVAADEAAIAAATRLLTREASQAIAAVLLKGKGRFRIRCAESDAQVLINGKNFGRLVGKWIKMRAGLFEVKLEKPGFLPFSGMVLVRPNGDTDLSTTLKAGEPPVVASGPSSIEPVVIPRPGEPAAELPAPPPETTPEVPTSAPPTPPPAEPAAEKPAAEKPATKAEVPAWAVYEKPKPIVPATETETETETSTAESPQGGTRWYKAWWFWTVVGVAVVGGGVGGLAGAGVLDLSGGGGASGTGSATFQWE